MTRSGSTRKFGARVEFEDGLRPSSLYLDYNPHEEYLLPKSVDNALSALWADAVDSNPDLFDGGLMNVLGLEQLSESWVVSLGPASYRDYYASVQFFDAVRRPQDYQITDEGLHALTGSVNVARSCSAVVVDDKLVLGRRSDAVASHLAGSLSTPGSGFLNRQHDLITVSDSRVPRQTEQLILQEVTAEVGVRDSEVEETLVLGIWEELLGGTTQSTAILSVVETSVDEATVRARWQDTTDEWEFEGPLLLVPVGRSGPLETFLDVALTEGEPRGRIAEWADAARSTTDFEATPTTVLLSLRLGKYRFGDDWYRRQLERYGDDLEVV